MKIREILNLISLYEDENVVDFGDYREKARGPDYQPPKTMNQVERFPNDLPAVPAAQTQQMIAQINRICVGARFFVTYVYKKSPKDARVEILRSPAKTIIYLSIDSGNIETAEFKQALAMLTAYFDKWNVAILLYISKETGGWSQIVRNGKVFGITKEITNAGFQDTNDTARSLGIDPDFVGTAIYVRPVH